METFEYGIKMCWKKWTKCKIVPKKLKKCNGGDVLIQSYWNLFALVVDGQLLSSFPASDPNPKRDSIIFNRLGGGCGKLKWEGFFIFKGNVTFTF